MAKLKILFLVIISISLLSIFCLVPSKLDAKTFLSEESMAIPVLILVDLTANRQSAGSGFYYKKNNDFYFVTARHVLFKNAFVQLDSSNELHVPNHLQHKIGYDQNNRRLIFQGRMSEEEKSELKNQNDNEQIKEKIDLLFEQTQSLQLKGQKATLLSYYAPIKDPNSIDELELQLNTLLNKDLVKYNFSDIAVIKIANTVKKNDYFDIDLLKEVVLKKRSKSGIKSIFHNDFKYFKDVNVSNEVFIFGYPVSIALISNQFDIKKPLLRKGIIAGKNEVFKTIILDCPVYKGQSGGLVMEVEPVSALSYKLRAIGIVSEFVPYQIGENIFENTGYSITVPLDEIDDLVSSFKSTKK